MKYILALALSLSFLTAAQDSTGTDGSDHGNNFGDHTGSNAPMIDFMNSADWSFFLDKLSISFKVCTCPKGDGPLPVGFAATLIEPLLGFSSSNQPMHLVGLGMELDSDVLSKRGTSRSDLSGAAGEGDTSGFRQANIVTFPILALIAAALPDIVCFDRNSEITANYISDVDPLYNNEILSNSTNSAKPTSRAFFTNMVADMACVADCTSATAGYPLNSLYFCDGCRGNMGSSDTGWTRLGDPIENSEMIALRQIASQHETLRLFKTSNASMTFTGGNELPDTMCGDKMFPMLLKSQYYIQLAYGSAKRFGAMRFHYDFKSTPADKDAFFFWIWRQRDFCAGATKC